MVTVLLLPYHKAIASAHEHRPKPDVTHVVVVHLDQIFNFFGVDRKSEVLLVVGLGQALIAQLEKKLNLTQIRPWWQSSLECYD